MSGELQTLLLVLLLMVALANLLIAFLLWRRHDDLAHRVVRLEANQQHLLTPYEVRQIHERLASIEGSLAVTSQVMKTIQEHLLENEQ